MSKGAKSGQNRFAASQKNRLDYRANRIENVIIPKLKAISGRVEFRGITPFCRFCADLYNTDLPLNDKPIGYRTIVQNSKYWDLLGPIYYKYWDKDNNGTKTKDKLIGVMAAKRANKLSIELERVKQENEALRAVIRNYGAADIDTKTPTISDSELYRSHFDKTCRAINLIIQASEGMFETDIQSAKITCNFNDLEPEEGLVPSQLAKPYIEWLKSKQGQP